jgi:hypothetical protein
MAKLQRAARRRASLISDKSLPPPVDNLHAIITYGKAAFQVHRQTDRSVEYLANDTRNDQRVRRRYSNAEFLAILKEQVPDRSRHNIRYFPRSKSCAWGAVLSFFVSPVTRPVENRMLLMKPQLN